MGGATAGSAAGSTPGGVGGGLTRLDAREVSAALRPKRITAQPLQVGWLPVDWVEGVDHSGNGMALIGVGECTCHFATLCTVVLAGWRLDMLA